MSDDPNDRAARLAGRWGADDSDGEAVEEAESAAESDSTDAESGSGSVYSSEPVEDDDGELTTREMQSQMLYLPPEFHKELDLTFEELNLRFRRERDRKLQKNKDFYAGLLQLGLEQLGSVRDQELDEIEDLLDL